MRQRQRKHKKLLRRLSRDLNLGRLCYGLDGCQLRHAGDSEIWLTKIRVPKPMSEQNSLSTNSLGQTDFNTDFNMDFTRSTHVKESHVKTRVLTHVPFGHVKTHVLTHEGFAVQWVIPK
jgi:hypothetical protein